TSHDIVPVNTRSESHSFENEREILYKILFDLRNDVMELKKQMQSQRGAADMTGVPMKSSQQERPITYYHQDVTYPMAHTSKNDEEFQTPEEYIEETLSLDDWERQMVIKALEKNKGKRKLAAQDLKISERTLYRKIKEYGLDKDFDE
ncbi:MAG: sigma-54-dependent Fis family transcriptional regulator, partial [Paraprevotella sp.]|nr:sigma-54-dependent Fis family transcriptional regulator [Paraprevotella sp.]